MNKILVIGANGQLGTDLTEALRKKYGLQQVVAADIQDGPTPALEQGPFEHLDVMDAERLSQVVNRHQINEVYLLAAMLSATAEKKPQIAWKLNMEGLLNVLELGKAGILKKIYWPSSIAVFGPNTPKNNTPQHTIMEPNTVYGLSKLAGERWCQYYYEQYGVDVRSLRYPGLIGWKALPGGGTTDYAVDIYHQALKQGHYQCFLSQETALPMMYMPDAIKATMQLMEAPASQIKIRSSYNIGAMSFTPAQVAQRIQKHLPNFAISYKPDERQRIANSWPASIDHAAATEQWGWEPAYQLDNMTRSMLEHLAPLYGQAAVEQAEQTA